MKNLLKNGKILTLENFLNEDIDIPAELSPQYLTVQKQISDKEAQKNLLLKQVNQKDVEIGVLQKNLLAIQVKAAQLQGKTIAAQKEVKPAVQATSGKVATNESIDEAFSDDIDLLDPLDDEEEEEKVRDEDEKEWLFALRINDSTEEEEIIAKVYKNDEDDFWKIRIVQGSEEPLESMQFDPDMDMVSVIEKIGEIYDEVEELDLDEYENLLDDKEEQDEKYKYEDEDN